MILRIYWTDRYMRQAQGLKNATHGMQKRLARQFATTPAIIKKIVSIKHNSPGRRRKRYPTVKLQSIQTSIKNRLRQQYGDLECLRSRKC